MPRAGDAARAGTGDAPRESAPGPPPGPAFRSGGHGDRDSDEALDPERVVARLAAAQHGVVTRAQLLAAGLSAHVIRHRVRTERFRVIHRGVYRIGPVVGSRHREWAAVLACGPRAVLSHRSAASLLELLPPPRRQRPVDVSGPRTLRGSHRGVRVHRVRRLDPDEVQRREGLPVTRPARCLLDLAGRVPPRTLERALARAERQGLLKREDLAILLQRRPGRRGLRTLRILLDRWDGPALTRSEAEERFLELVRKAGLERPATNAMIEGLEVDAVWRTRRLVVEVDGFAHHAGRAAFEEDRQRDAILTAAGYRVLRVTWRQLTEETEAVLVRLGQALARG